MGGSYDAIAVSVVHCIPGILYEQCAFSLYWGSSYSSLEYFRISSGPKGHPVAYLNARKETKTPNLTYDILKYVPGGLRRGGRPPALAMRMPVFFKDA